MSERYNVEWEPTVQARAMTLTDDDPDGVLAVFTATDLLADNPRCGARVRPGAIPAQRDETGTHRGDPASAKSAPSGAVGISVL